MHLKHNGSFIAASIDIVCVRNLLPPHRNGRQRECYNN